MSFSLSSLYIKRLDEDTFFKKCLKDSAFCGTTMLLYSEETSLINLNIAVLILIFNLKVMLILWRMFSMIEASFVSSGPLTCEHSGGCSKPDVECETLSTMMVHSDRMKCSASH